SGGGRRKRGRGRGKHETLADRGKQGDSNEMWAGLAVAIYNGAVAARVDDGGWLRASARHMGRFRAPDGTIPCPERRSNRGFPRRNRALEVTDERTRAVPESDDRRGSVVRLRMAEQPEEPARVHARDLPRGTAHRGSVLDGTRPGEGGLRDGARPR